MRNNYDYLYYRKWLKNNDKMTIENEKILIENIVKFVIMRL